MAAQFSAGPLDLGNRAQSPADLTPIPTGKTAVWEDLPPTPDLQPHRNHRLVHPHLIVVVVYTRLSRNTKPASGKTKVENAVYQPRYDPSFLARMCCRALAWLQGLHHISRHVALSDFRAMSSSHGVRVVGLRRSETFFILYVDMLAFLSDAARV